MLTVLVVFGIFLQVFKCVCCCFAAGGKLCIWQRIFQCVHATGGRVSCCVCQRCFGHVAIVREKLYCLPDAFSSCFGNIYSVAGVMIQGHAKVPTILAVGIPRALLTCRFVENYFGARRGEESSVVIKDPV